MTPVIEIYTREGCGHCVQTKQLLTSHDIPYAEVKIGVDIDREQVINKYPDQRTLPIIVVNGNVVGGNQELQLLVENNQLQYLTE